MIVYIDIFDGTVPYRQEACHDHRELKDFIESCYANDWEFEIWW